jgi:hypothetical protein
MQNTYLNETLASLKDQSVVLSFLISSRRRRRNSKLSASSLQLSLNSASTGINIKVFFTRNARKTEATGHEETRSPFNFSPDFTIFCLFFSQILIIFGEKEEIK